MLAHVGKDVPLMLAQLAQATLVTVLVLAGLAAIAGGLIADRH